MISKEMLNVIQTAHVVDAANSRYLKGVQHHGSCVSNDIPSGVVTTKDSPWLGCDCGATEFSEALQLLAKMCAAERGGTQWFATREELQTEMERIEQS